jgi:hypothetical protein
MENSCRALETPNLCQMNGHSGWDFETNFMTYHNLCSFCHEVRDFFNCHIEKLVALHKSEVKDGKSSSSEGDNKKIALRS